MVAADSITSNFPTIPTGFLPESNPGIASLDSPQVQQTKAEIRSLVSEIADLSNRKITPIEFYGGMLPRVCAAMGATGACVWRVTAQPSFSIIAQHTLPSGLTVTDSLPSQPHQRILECVYAEGQPVLVPPGSVSLEVARPTNPLDEALLVVPVCIDDQINYMLEVVQRPGGGPVAQRGYLRFVAQMADLMADFLRRDSLRWLTGQQEYVARFHQALIAVAGSKSNKHRSRMLAEALDDLLDARQTILLSGGARYRVEAISGIETHDPRSETVLLAPRVVNKFAKSLGTSIAPIARDTNPATDHSNAYAVLFEIYPPANGTLGAGRESDQAAAKQLCEILGARRLFALSLQRDRSVIALLPYGDEPIPDRLETRANELFVAFAPLLEQTESYLSRNLSRLGWRPKRFESNLIGDTSLYATVQRWILRLGAAGLAVAIGLFPVPQQVTVTALLEPAEKQIYYAPSAALVDIVHVDQDSHVNRGEVLLELVDQQLQTQIDQLLGQQTETRSQIAQIQSTLSRNAQLPAIQRDQLEGQKEQLAVTSSTLDAQLQILQNQLSELKIVARQEGEVASWDLRNRLSARPVQAGQLLLTTFRPDGPWRLQLSIPEYRVGLISQAIDSSNDGARVRFSLSSHPGEAREGRVTVLGAQAVHDSTGQAVVLASAKIESATLPIKKDGAVARATIDCGRVPAAWLVLRDAFWAVSSRFKMIW